MSKPVNPLVRDINFAIDEFVKASNWPKSALFGARIKCFNCKHEFFSKKCYGTPVSGVNCPKCDSIACYVKMRKLNG
jgi:ribosomal protein S27E